MGSGKKSFIKIVVVILGLTALLAAPVAACSLPPGVPAVEETMSISVIKPVSQTSIAAFALGCFWGSDAWFGSLPGVISTRVGYAGGTLENPTYHRLGNHTETVEVTYDPAVIAYERLLEVFWDAHEPVYPVIGQYASIIFFYDAGQESAARQSLAAMETEQGGKVYTSIRPAGTFYPAEDYHQKYYLGLEQEAAAILHQIYPSPDDYIMSTAAARLNALAGGHGDVSLIMPELCALGFNETTVSRLFRAFGEDIEVYCTAGN